MITKPKKKLPKYVRQRTWGAYQYKRNVPKRLIGDVGKETIYHSLGSSYSEMITTLPLVHNAVEEFFTRLAGQNTTDRTLALVEARYGRKAADQLEAGDVDENFEWALWDLGHQLEDDVELEVLGNLLGASVPTKIFTLSDAYDLYAEYKDADNNKNLSKYLNRTKTDLLAILGAYKVNTAGLTKLTRKDATKYRDALMARVSPNSVNRYNNTIKAVINHAITELGIHTYLNPFNKLRIKGAGSTAGDRKSLTEKDVVAVRDAIPTGDLQALFVALCDTGARLAEVSGALCGDINLQDRSLTIQANHFRSLKTDSSKRTVPLSERAYNLLFKLKHGREDSEPLFVRYGKVNGNTNASAALMKHFRKVIDDPLKSIHSLRHRKKDQLRSVEAPEEISKVLLGHSNKDVASRYGDGFQQDVLRKWLSKTW